MCSNFGVTVSSTETRHMVTGRLAEDSNKDPIAVNKGAVTSRPRIFCLFF